MKRKELGGEGVVRGKGMGRGGGGGVILTLLLFQRVPQRAGGQD